MKDPHSYAAGVFFEKVPNFSRDFIVFQGQSQALSVDRRVGSSKVDETAVAGETILGSLLYGGNKRDGVVCLAGDS